MKYKPMMKLKLLGIARTLLLFLGLAAGVAACDDDDKLPTAPKGDTETPADANNKNKNNTAALGEALGRLEVPRVSDDANSVVLVRTVPTYGVNYIIEYDTRKRSQRWTCWQWYQGNSGTSWNRKNWNAEAESNEWVRLNLQNYGFSDPFQPDPDLPAGQRTELDEYKGSGYQRGHICASADRLNSKEANEQTFYLSNIMPQSGALNEGIWLEMENKVQSWGKDKDFRQTLYVVKGGTIDDANIRAYTQTGMVVPKYFYMALLCEDPQGEYKAMAFWVEHTSRNESGRPLRNYVKSVRELEQLTGIDFFCNLPDDVEERVETATTTQIVSDWGL